MITGMQFPDWFQVYPFHGYLTPSHKANSTSWPYIWTWNEKAFGKHTIKVIAYDSKGEISSKEIEVFKFL